MDLVRTSGLGSDHMVRVLLAVMALGLMAACGGGVSGDEVSPNDNGTPSAATGVPADAELPVVIDPAQRADFRRSLLPLLSGSYGNGCLSSNGAGQLTEGGGPIVVADATAMSATSSLDLLAPELDLSLYRYFDGSMGSPTGAAIFSRRSGADQVTFSVSTVNDAVDGPNAVATWSRNADSSVVAGCSGPVPPLASADVFGAVRRFLVDGPIRMLDCQTSANGTSITPVRGGAVSVGPREIMIDGGRIGIDDQGKQAEGVVLLKDALLRYDVKWPGRDVSLEFDDGGHIRQAVLSETSPSLRAVICKRPAR